jgi:hypothetical protein
VRTRRFPRLAFLIGVCLLAIAVRLSVGAALLSQGGTSFVLASDDGDAYDAAARWQATGTPIVMTDRLLGKWDPATPLEARWPQGYWLFLAAQYRLFGSAYVSTLILQALLAAGGVLAVFALAARVLTEGAARVAALAQAISSTGIYISAALYAESLYVPLLLGGLALVVGLIGLARMSRPALAAAFGAGVLFGLAQVTRPLGVPVLGLGAVWLAWASRAPSADRVRCIVALSAGFVVALVPFVVHDLATLGRVAVFTAGGAEALRDQTAGGGSLLERAFALFVAGGWVPLGEPAISSLGGLGTLLGRLAEWVLVAVGGAWLVMRSCRATAAAGWLLVAATGAIVGPALLIGLPLVRYRVPADPIFIIWMVAGVQAVRRAHVAHASATLNLNSIGRPRGGASS